jgi:hypothetical protein
MLKEMLIALAALAGLIVLASCFGSDDDDSGSDDLPCTMKEICTDRTRCTDLYQYSVDECTEYMDNASDRCAVDKYISCLCECIGLDCEAESAADLPPIMDCRNNCENLHCDAQ